ncbi:hypothetical protein WMY93_001940 [Mugilogobius chulae]|uniref:SNTX thioredoxin-like domain-containing protein n=1 Tax=Mugilogobius chulae TaxID=88201 RepID=A0AAW0PVF4_9GOBI
MNCKAVESHRALPTTDNSNHLTHNHLTHRPPDPQTRPQTTGPSTSEDLIAQSFHSRPERTTMAQEEKVKNSQIVVGGLGRPFTLGMLYNASKDELIPGMAVLDSKTLQELTVSRSQQSSHFDICASDSTKDSSFNLNVNASLKLSFLSGLIEVGGSANYLKNKKQSQNQSRVTLQYQATTHFEQLSLTTAVCDKIQSSQIYEKGLGTHLVTGIEYGANAFFVFDSQKIESSDVQTVKGQMEVTIKKIPECEISGEFYGDFLLESNPATFEAAVQTYVTLPKLLMGAKGSKTVSTVPVKVWLLPLEVFSLKPGPVTRGISVGLMLEAEDTLEALHSITMRCNDCLSVSAVGKFPQLQQQLHSFYKLCHYYRVELQRLMAETCPAIREGTVQESVLRDVFEQTHTSPFSQDRLKQWLQDKERELNVVQSCLDIMKGIPVLSTQAQLDKFVLAPGDEERYVYTFTSLGTADARLEEMGRYLNALKVGKPYDPSAACVKAAVQWFYSKVDVAAIRERAVYFNYENCRITARDENEYTGSAIYKYHKGVLVDSWNVTYSGLSHKSITVADLYESDATASVSGETQTKDRERERERGEREREREKEEEKRRKREREKEREGERDRRKRKREREKRERERETKTESEGEREREGERENRGKREREKEREGKEREQEREREKKEGERTKKEERERGRERELRKERRERQRQREREREREREKREKEERGKKKEREGKRERGRKRQRHRVRGEREGGRENQEMRERERREREKEKKEGERTKKGERVSERERTENEERGRENKNKEREGERERERREQRKGREKGRELRKEREKRREREKQRKERERERNMKEREKEEKREREKTKKVERERERRREEQEREERGRREREKEEKGREKRENREIEKEKEKRERGERETEREERKREEAILGDRMR